MEGGEFNFCKCHSVSQYNNKKEKKSKFKNRRDQKK
jgi:hypothetical protein